MPRDIAAGRHIVVFNGKTYWINQDQWRRLQPQIKGLADKERGEVGYRFLREEGILK